MGSQIKAFITVVFFILITACDSEDIISDATSTEDDLSPQPVYSIGNTSAVAITGSKIGNNTNPMSSLHKQIAFNITNGDSRLLFDNAYISRPYLATQNIPSDAIYWLVFVTNVTSDEILCFVRLSNGEFKNSSGQTIETYSVDYVSGTPRRFVLSATETNTCLLPGERGLFSGIKISGGLYANTTELIFDSISMDSSTTEALAVNIVHGGIYDATTIDRLNLKIELPVSNLGSVSGVMTPYSLHVLVDATDRPILSGFLSPPDGWDGILGVNEEAVLVGPAIPFNGTAEKMYVYLDYETATTAPALARNYMMVKQADFTNIDEYNKYLHDLRNQQESYNQSLVAP